jgi:hypothetical protein
MDNRFKLPRLEVAGEYIRTARTADDLRGLSVARMERENPDRAELQAEMVRACNAHDALVSAAVEVIRTELLDQRSPAKIAALAALRRAVAAAASAA